MFATFKIDIRTIVYQWSRCKSIDSFFIMWLTQRNHFFVFSLSFSLAASFSSSDFNFHFHFHSFIHSSPYFCSIHIYIYPFGRHHTSAAHSMCWQNIWKRIYFKLKNFNECIWNERITVWHQNKSIHVVCTMQHYNLCSHFRALLSILWFCFFVFNFPVFLRACVLCWFYWFS